MSDLVLEKSTGVSNPLVLIQAAIDKGTPIEHLQKLFDLAERWEKNRAAEAWADAIKSFQSKMPEVTKGNPVKNRAGEFMYAFADYSDIMKVAQPILNEFGITVTFSTAMSNTLMTTTCHVRVGIHVEDTSVTLALPAIPNANDAQRAGGALKYGQRYALAAALNIRIVGEDNDANGQVEMIDQDEVRKINEAMEACQKIGHPMDYARFKKWLEIEDLSELPKAKFQLAIDELRRHYAAGQKINGKK